MADGGDFTREVLHRHFKAKEIGVEVIGPLGEKTKSKYSISKKVAIIEAEKKNENDKTYCFWASPNDAIVKELPKKIPHIFISSAIQKNLVELKDVLWKALNKPI